MFRMRPEIFFPSFADHPVSLGRTSPSANFGALPFQLFVDIEEVLNLSQVMRNYMLNVLNRIESRIPVHHA